MPSRRTKLLVALGIALATVAVYAGLLGAGFVSLDDPAYVVKNETVRAGITLRGLAWAFTTIEQSNWHPLTWISHMLDAQLFGTNAAGHHATSVLLHVANAVLLLLALDRMTRSFWPSAFVAAVFALHPTHVESVAWVSERKDVLSTLFLMLTLLAYARYAEGPSRGRLAAVVLLYALGLMAKPMLVTLPFVLLLLDAWPLARLRDAGARRLAIEKTPLFLLAGASCVATYFAQSAGGAVAPIEVYTLPLRVGNALASYLRYLGKTFWPADLAVFYPFPVVFETKLVLASFALIVLVTWFAIRERTRSPWLMVGWLWFLGTLVPVIGLVQVGAQGMADRYTYVPSIGILIAVAWTLRPLAIAVPRIALAASIAVPLALAATTRAQVATWKSSRTLFEHAIAVTTDNALAQQALGAALVEDLEYDAAILHLDLALRLVPDFPEAHHNMGTALGRKGRFEEAIPHFQSVLRGMPRSAKAHKNLAYVLAQLKRYDEAIAEYEKGLEFEPDDFESNKKLGLLLGGAARYEESLVHLRRALASEPGDRETLYATGITLQSLGRYEEALAEYGSVLVAHPDDVPSLDKIAWIRATSSVDAVRDAADAVRLAERVRDLEHPTTPAHLATLAAAYAEAGRFDEAATTCESAIAAAQAAGRTQDVERFRRQLESYRAHAPWRVP